MKDSPPPVFSTDLSSSTPAAFSYPERDGVNDISKYSSVGAVDDEKFVEDGTGNIKNQSGDPDDFVEGILRYFHDFLLTLPALHEIEKRCRHAFHSEIAPHHHHHHPSSNNDDEDMWLRGYSFCRHESVVVPSAGDTTGAVRDATNAIDEVGECLDGIFSLESVVEGLCDILRRAHDVHRRIKVKAEEMGEAEEMFSEESSTQPSSTSPTSQGYHQDGTPQVEKLRERQQQQLQFRLEIMKEALTRWAIERCGASLRERRRTQVDQSRGCLAFAPGLGGRRGEEGAGDGEREEGEQQSSVAMVNGRVLMSLGIPPDALESARTLLSSTVIHHLSYQACGTVMGPLSEELSMLALKEVERLDHESRLTQYEGTRISSTKVAGGEVQRLRTDRHGIFTSNDLDRLQFKSLRKIFARLQALPFVLNERAQAGVHRIRYVEVCYFRPQDEFTLQRFSGLDDASDTGRSVTAVLFVSSKKKDNEKREGWEAHIRRLGVLPKWPTEDIVSCSVVSSELFILQSRYTALAILPEREACETVRNIKCGNAMKTSKSSEPTMSSSSDSSSRLVALIVHMEATREAEKRWSRCGEL